ncbi:MAG TPA: hypothetical protein VGN51_22040 [Acidimicrobiia bacterium]|jgi:hypothetical protein
MSSVIDEARRPGSRASTTVDPPPEAPTEPDADTASRAASPLILSAVLVVASVIAGYCIHAHAMWFDEVQAWNIARASHSVGSLYSNLRYEGHPILWYLPLFAISRFTADPRAMQVFEWAVLTCTYAVILFKAPFSIAVRTAIVAGYFVTFEYGVISRSYSVEMLLLVLALVCLAQPKPAWGPTGVLLVLLAWTSMAGGVLVVAVGLTIGWCAWSERASRHTSRWWGKPLVVAAAGIVSAGIAAITCIPPADYHSFALGIPNAPLSSFSPQRFQVSLAGPWRGLFPLPAGIGRWNTNVLDQLPQPTALQALLGLSVVGAIAWAIRAHPFALRLWLVGAAGYLVFSYVVVLPDRSHYAGEYFLLFLACVWCAAASPQVDPGPNVRATRRRSRVTLGAVVAVVLGAQVVAMVTMLPAQTQQEFAPNRFLATTAERHGLAHDVVSAQDFDAVTMSAYLERPVWSIARGADIAYFSNDETEARGYAHLTNAKIVCAAAEVARERSRPVALVTDRDLGRGQGRELLATSHGVTLWRVVASASDGSTCTATGEA